MTIDIDEAKVEKNELGLWAGWVLATAGGMLLGFLPAKLIADALGLGVAQVLVPLLAGALIGFLQWLALRRYLVGSVDWIFTAGAGWAIGYALGLLLVQQLGAQVSAGGFWLALISYLLFGLIIGLVQWPVLRREIPNLAAWIIANMIGWTVGFFLATLAEFFLYSNFRLEPWLISMIVRTLSGLVAGGIVGVALVWIVRKPEADSVAVAD
jgi:hypothetical protein